MHEEEWQCAVPVGKGRERLRQLQKQTSKQADRKKIAVNRSIIRQLALARRKGSRKTLRRGTKMGMRREETKER